MTTSIYEQMRGFLKERLRDSYTVHTEQIQINGFPLHYLLLDNSRAVFLIHQKIPFKSLGEAAARLHERHITPGGYVFAKGDVFFKSDARWGHIKRNRGELTGYSEEDISHMMLLAPEEVYAHTACQGRIQYYQPQSSRLEESLVNYTSRPVDPERGGKTYRSGFSLPQPPANWILTEEFNYDGPLQLLGVTPILLPANNPNKKPSDGKQ